MIVSGGDTCRAVAFVACLTACVLPAAAQAPPPPIVPEAPAAPPPAAIEVNTLGSPDGPAVGLLDHTNGGLGGEIWSGSPRGLVESLMARLPLATPVASVRNLARRVAVTKADAPVGEAQQPFQAVRIEALIDAGRVDEAAALAVQAHIKDDEAFAALQGMAILLGERTADACGDATATRLSSAEAFWIQLRAYCYAAGGQGDLLELTRGVMKAQGSDDPQFETLLNDVLTHKTVDPGEIHDPNPLDVFLMRLAGLPLSPRLAEKFGLSGSVLVLRDGKNPAEARAEAAEQVVHSGAVSSVELGVIADAQVFTPAQLAAADAVSSELPFFVGQALIRQALAHEARPETKAALLAVALKRGEDMGLLPAAAGLQATGLAMLKPGPATRPQVPLFARSLLLAGDPDVAERWRESLDARNDADAPLAAELAVELNLKAPNAGRAARAQEALTWLAQNAVSLQPAGGPSAQRFGALVVGVCDALDEPMAPEAKAQAAALAQTEWPGRKIAPGILKHLAEMRGQPDKKGEALLTILDAVGAQGPGDLAPNAAATLVRALKAEGEAEAARALAADALLLYKPMEAESFHFLAPPAKP